MLEDAEGEPLQKEARPSTKRRKQKETSFPRLGGEKSLKLLTGIESTPLKRNSTTYQKNCTRLGGETSPHLLARIESIPQIARILNKTILKRMGEMLYHTYMYHTYKKECPLQD